MKIPAPAPPAPDVVRWLNNQPYLLLSLTALFWAGNIVLARYVAGHVPPMTLSCVRWIGALLMLLPFAWPHLRRDWPALRARLPLIVVLSATGFAINNALSYWALPSRSPGCSPSSCAAISERSPASSSTRAT
jgi:drug/metabolite transporter (DMT)-like permease